MGATSFKQSLKTKKSQTRSKHIFLPDQLQYLEIKGFSAQ